MTFDWFIFAAQLFNFMLLIYLLRRFLYGPIMNYMDERQAAINAQLEEAKTHEENAEQTLTEYEEQKDRLQAERQSLITQAQAEAETLKQVLLKEARADVDKQREQWQEALAKEKDSFLEGLQKRATKAFFTAMHQALNDLADAELEQHIIKVFNKQLSQLTPIDQEALERAFVHTNHHARLVTAFPLELSQIHEIKQAIKTNLGQDVDLVLEQNSELGCGLELCVFDQKLTWTLLSYLDSLEKEMGQQLSFKEKTRGAEVVVV